MSQKKHLKQYSYWLITFASITVILMTIYFFLGGFEKIEIVKSGKADYAIAGKWLKQDASHKDEALLFNEIKESVTQEKIIGDLCIVNFQIDSLLNNEMKRFIGVALKNETSAIPSGYVVLEIRSEKSYMAALTMHPLVMPNSQKIERLISLVAIEDKAELQKFSLEILYPDNSVIIQMFSE